MKYLEPYAALTDDTLADLASTGLLRRSRKLSDDVTEADSDATGATLTIAGHTVRVDARGPGAVACECPTGGVCVHIVVACRWARGRAAELGVAAPEAESSSDAETHSDAETDPAGGADSAAGNGTDAEQSGDTAAADARKAPAKPRSKRPSAAQEARLAAARKRRETALAEVRAVVVHLIDGGLAHLRGDTPESLRALAGRVRVAAFEPRHGLRFEALLRTAAGQSTALAGHDDAVTEGDLFATLTEIWALAETHETAEKGAAGTTSAVSSADGTKARARGGNSRDEDEIDIARLVPLATRWWTGASGSRGLAFAAWDVDAHRVRTAVTGRPAGTDPGFRRDQDARLLWNTASSHLSAGAFAVAAVRARPDGTLGAGGNPRVTSLGEFELDELREIAERTGTTVPARDMVGFGRRPSQVRLLMVRDSGDISIDEVRQEVTWTVVDSTGTSHLLRIPVEERHTTDNILHILAGRWSVVAVTTERHAGRVEPAGIFLREHDGAIRLVSPSLIEQHQLGNRGRSFGHWDAWRKRIARAAGMRSRARAVAAVREPDPPVVRACDLAWEATVAVAATGRHRLTARQRSDVGQARALARDLGLATLERAIADLIAPDTGSGESGHAEFGEPAQVSPETLARAAFLIRRTREIASVSG